MNINTCDSQNALAYLQGGFTPSQEDEYLRHLDVCANCREHLDAIAGEDHDWSEIKELLGPHITGGHAATGSKTDHSSLPITVQQVVQSLQPTDSPDSMGRIDNFEVKGVVGTGAMGVVLKARDSSLDRIVALKVMNPYLAANGPARSRFEREAKSAAAVHHPNVVAIHGVRTSAKLPYLVMPYLKGTSLQQRVDTQGPLSLSEILRIGSQLAAGLAAAHRQGVIHRDIKPSNIMLDDGVEAAIITDFGLARIVDDATMTRTGVISGTPEFMSPEQARGDAIDCKSDIFSLGSLLYMLCTGYPPFRAQTSFGVLRRITDETPKPIRQSNPEIPEWLCEIIGDLQQKLPTFRPTASETQTVLERCLAHVYQPDQASLPEKYRATSTQTKSFPFRPVFFGALAMIATLTFLAVMISYGGNDDNTNKPPEVMPTTIGNAARSPEIYKTLNLEFPNPKKRGALVVDINRGFVEVTTHDQPQVVIEVLYPSSSTKASKNSKLQQQFSPSFDLDYKTDSNQIKLDTYNQYYALNLRIKVPKKTDLSLDTYLDGYLKVADVNGTIRTHSQHCDISLKNISGSAQAYSRNGDLDISFRNLSADADLDFETYIGSIDLALPNDAGITAAISSGRGTFGSEFDIAPISNSDLNGTPLQKLSDSEYRIGMINAGGIPLRLECAQGKISIREFSGK